MVKGKKGQSVDLLPDIILDGEEVEEVKPTPTLEPEKGTTEKKTRGRRAVSVDTSVEDGLSQDEVVEEPISLMKAAMIDDMDEEEEVVVTSSILDERVEDLEMVMPEYGSGIGAMVKKSWPFSRNGKEGPPMVKAVMITEKPYMIDFDATVKLEEVQEANIYPVKSHNKWVYPILVDEEGNWKNYPRQQTIPFTGTAFILWLARSWPEHKILREEEKSFWQKMSGYGIIAVVVLVILVIFLLMFFFITS